jgi:hypothetical protein
LVLGLVVAVGVEGELSEEFAGDLGRVGALLRLICAL